MAGRRRDEPSRHVVSRSPADQNRGAKQSFGSLAFGLEAQSLQDIYDSEELANRKVLIYNDNIVLNLV